MAEHEKGADHKAKDRVRSAAWRAVHPEEARTYNAAYYAAHPEKWKTYGATQRQTKPDKVKEYKTRWAAAHPEKIKAKGAAYYRANSEKIHERNARWRAANPEKFHAIQREGAARRRARKANAPFNDFTAAQWRAMQEAYDHRCAYCGKRRKGQLTRDHITPLSKGGAHTLSNIVPACKDCNMQKHAGPVLQPVQPLLLIVTASKEKKR
jgi:5-methylcytosine-specific restriction endonuclease McrA